VTRDLGELGRQDKNYSDEVLAALEAQRVKSLPSEPEPDELPRSRCEIVVYSGDEPTGLLLPKALRINGEVVYTPIGALYEVRGGGTEPLLLQLTLAPTSLCFLAGDPPDQAESTLGDAPNQKGDAPDE
jgi:hypothetical protein